jgi:hypothetical protein
MPKIADEAMWKIGDRICKVKNVTYSEEPIESSPFDKQEFPVAEPLVQSIKLPKLKRSHG